MMRISMVLSKREVRHAKMQRRRLMEGEGAFWAVKK